MTILFRADSNPAIGSGHMMRCLSIANAARGRGFDCKFIVAGRESGSLPMSRGYEVICLDSPYDELERELGMLSRLIAGFQDKILIIDSYHVTERYLSVLKGMVKTVYIDDLNRFIYPCDVLINHSICCGQFSYQSYDKRTVLLLGPAYAPLRKQFQRLPDKYISDRLEKVLLLTGGTDHHDLSISLVEKLADTFPHLQFTILLSQTAPFERLDRLSNIRILSPTDDMAPLMRDADLAISAAGTTLYELCACGTPFICFTLADNQLENAKTSGERGLACCAGDVKNGEDLLVSNVIHCLAKLSGFGEREKISKRIKGLTDGFGADRIVDHLLFLLSEGGD